MDFSGHAPYCLCMVMLFHEYRPDHARWLDHVKITGVMTLLPAIIAVVFLLGIGWRLPWIFAAGGLSAAMFLVLLGATVLDEDEHGLSPLGRRLAAAKKHWFPMFLVPIQSLTTILTILFFWMTLAHLFPPPPGLNVVLILTVLIIPLRRVMSIHHKVDPLAEVTLPEELIRAAFNILVTLLAALAIQTYGLNETPEGAAPVGAIMVWVPAVVIILLNIVLLIHHLVSRNR